MYKFIGRVFENGVYVEQLVNCEVICSQFVANECLPDFEEYLGQEGYVIEYVA